MQINIYGESDKTQQQEFQLKIRVPLHIKFYTTAEHNFNYGSNAQNIIYSYIGSLKSINGSSLP